MKKIIVLCSMIVALGFVAAGCGGGDSKPASTTETTQSADPHEGHDHGAAQTDENTGGGENQ